MGYDLARKPRLLYTGRKQSDQEVVKGDSSSHTVSLLKLSFFHSMEQLRNRYVSLFPPPPIKTCGTHKEFQSHNNKDKN